MRSIFLPILAAVAKEGAVRLELSQEQYKELIELGDALNQLGDTPFGPAAGKQKEVQSLADVEPAFGNEVTPEMGNISRAQWGWFSRAWAWVKRAARTVVRVVKKAAVSVWNWVKRAANTVKNAFSNLFRYGRFKPTAAQLARGTRKKKQMNKNGTGKKLQKTVAKVIGANTSKVSQVVKILTTTAGKNNAAKNEIIKNAGKKKFIKKIVAKIQKKEVIRPKPAPRKRGGYWKIYKYNNICWNQQWTDDYYPLRGCFAAVVKASRSAAYFFHTSWYLEPGDRSLGRMNWCGWCDNLRSWDTSMGRDYKINTYRLYR